MVIDSTHSLEIQGVYTTASLKRGKCCGVELGRHSSIDVERIAEREVERRPPNDDENGDDLPDLIPERPFPRPPANAPATLPQNYCMQAPDGGPRAEAIRVRVRNQGAGGAGMSTVAVQFVNPHSGPVGTLTGNVDPLGPGAAQTVDFDIPRRCYSGSGAGCSFRITVDSPPPQVAESDEGNNTDSSGCPGVAP